MEANAAHGSFPASSSALLQSKVEAASTLESSPLNHSSELVAPTPRVFSPNGTMIDCSLSAPEREIARCFNKEGYKAMPDNREKMQGQQGKSSSSQHAMDKDDNSQKNKQAGSRSADQRQTMKGGSKKSNK